MDELVLYHAPGACSAVAYSLLLELDIRFRLVLMKSGSNGYEAADGTISHRQYRQIHPCGFVPALTVTGETVTELPAILTHIASLRPERHLLGNGPMEEARVVEWASWLSGHLHGIGIGMLARPERFVDEEGLHHAIRAKGREVFQEGLELIEERLRGREFPVKGGETIIDFYLVIFWVWGQKENFDVLGGRYPSYKALMERMERKKSVRTVLEADKSPLTSF